jgi:hypothetical protein
MVRVIADTSCNSPTASSCDRYKYRYGYNYQSHNSGKNEREETIYRRPVPTVKEKPVSKKEKDPIYGGGGDGDGDGDGKDVIKNGTGCINYYIDIIKEKINNVNNICVAIDAMIMMRPKMCEMHESCEINKKSMDSEMKMKIEEEEREKEEREKEEREKEEREREEREKEEKRKLLMINKKLGQIIYHSPSGEKFTAAHSIHMHSESHFDKKTKQMITNTTQKIVWNDKIYNSKEIWFREMAMTSLSADPPMDENAKIVRCM